MNASECPSSVKNTLPAPDHTRPLTRTLPLLITWRLFLTGPDLEAQVRSEVDTAYVKDFSHLLTARVFASTKFDTLRLFGNGLKDDLLYRPNNQINIGIGVSY